MGELKGKIFNIQNFCLHDGGGVRTIIFLKGCPLRCKWCSNPESQSPAEEILFFDFKCIGCGRCTEISGKAPKDNTDCFECARACPSEALKICGRDYTVDETVRICEKERLLFETSEGGVTLSGGEPLFQGEFCVALLKRLKEKYFHTTMETCGYPGKDIFQNAVEYCDEILFDIKVLDEKLHIRYTGVSNVPILENLRIAAKKGKKFVIRIPFITGVNDDDTFIDGIIRLAAELQIAEVHLLPYHELGIEKYRRIGRNYDFYGAAPSEDRLNVVIEKFQSNGISAILRG